MLIKRNNQKNKSNPKVRQINILVLPEQSDFILVMSFFSYLAVRQIDSTT